MKNKVLLIILTIFIVCPMWALDDLLIFTGEDNTGEIGVSLSLPYNPGGLNSANMPSFRANAIKEGINESDICFAMVSASNAMAWNTMAQLDILGGGLTPEMMEARPYLKVMVWRNIDSQEMCIQVNKQNWESDNNIYRATPAKEEWVDLVINLDQLRGSGNRWPKANWADSTITSFRFLPLAWNRSVGQQVVLRVDNIALSDNPEPRTQAPETGPNHVGDIMIENFEPDTEGEIGLTNIRAVAPEKDQFEQVPGVYENPYPGGINTTPTCLAMRTKPGATRWQCYAIADFDNGGITPLMMAKRKYLKMMVWRDYDLNTLRILLNNSDWNASTYIYNGKPLKGEWVDLVIDLSKSYGGTIWGNQTLTSIMFEPIENNSAGLGVPVTLLIDNIVLSDDPFPRTPEDMPVNPDIAIAYQRMYDDMLATVTPDTAKHYLSQNANGSWDDIDYKNTASVYWPCVDHLTRIKEMARLYADQTDTTTLLARQLRSGIIQGILYWEEVLPTSSNWFYNDISKQMEFESILILARDILPDNLIRQICRYFVIGTVNPTGANLTAMARGIFTRGVMLNNIQTIREAVAYMQSVVDISDKAQDGFQVDNSFIFHGKQVFSYNYNSGLIRDVGTYMKYAKDLSFAFDMSYLANMCNTTLEFNRWFTWGTWLDYNSNGRVISMPDREKVASNIDNLKLLAELNVENRDTYSYLINCAKQGARDTLCGNRMFYRADYMVHRKPSYYIGLKMFSKRISGSEMGNGQNLKGYWLGFGATTLYRTGEEFLNIFPLWDWTKVPGTTAANELPSFGWDLKQSATFVGGVSDSITGVATMKISNRDVYAQKSWMMFDDAVVALGAGITSDNANDIYTSVAQCYLNGDVWVNGVKAERGTGRALQQVNHIYHDSIGYFFPEGQTIHLLNTEKSGQWSSISTAESATTVKGDVFNVWYEHGNKPTDGSYAYVIVPNIGQADMKSYADNMPVRILCNTSKKQAATHLSEQKTGIVFYEAGEVEINANLKIRAYQACALLVDHSGKYVKVSLSDPDQSLSTAKIDLIYGETKETLEYDLPAGNYTGAGSIQFGQIEYHNPTTGLNSTMKTEIHFSPSIVTNAVYISRLNTPTKIEILNMQGQIVGKHIITTTLDMSAYNAGIYMICINGKIMGKIIKR